MCESSDANALAIPAVAWTCHSFPDRQQVNAGARASPCWTGGRRRPTEQHYASTDNMRKIREIGHRKTGRQDTNSSSSCDRARDRSYYLPLPLRPFSCSSG
jgi:hypothetical protein